MWVFCGPKAECYGLYQKCLRETSHSEAHYGWKEQVWGGMIWKSVFLVPDPSFSLCFLATMIWAAFVHQVIPPCQFGPLEPDNQQLHLLNLWARKVSSFKLQMLNIFLLTVGNWLIQSHFYFLVIFLRFHILHEICDMYLSFGLWFMSCNMVISRSIHLFTNVIISFFLVAE